jgi:hypothetical protein
MELQRYGSSGGVGGRPYVCFSFAEASSSSYLALALLSLSGTWRYPGIWTCTTCVCSHAMATPRTAGPGHFRRERRARVRRGRARAHGARRRRRCGGWRKMRLGRARVRGLGEAGTRRGCARHRTRITAHRIRGAAGVAAAEAAGGRIRTLCRRAGPLLPTPSSPRAWAAAPRSTSPGPRVLRATVEAAGPAVEDPAVAAVAAGRRLGCRSRRRSRRGLALVRLAIARSPPPATAPRSSLRQLRRLLGPRHRAACRREGRLFRWRCADAAGKRRRAG